MNNIYCVSYLSDIGGAYAGSAQGPAVLKNSPYLLALEKHGIKLHWQPSLPLDTSQDSKLKKITNLCKKLSKETAQLVQEKKFFLVFGGDHSVAVGTWSGVASALQTQGEMGLIWIDAHMDSHTPETSETGNIHGMPLASLLGHGFAELTQIVNPTVKLNPTNVCLIGIRSFEAGEAEFLAQQKVRVFFMEEIKQRGLPAVMQEAISHVTAHTAGFGISLDIDSIDPQDAPGTGIAEPDGLSGKELCAALGLSAGHPKLIGAEIVEFDPARDKNQITEKLIANLIFSLVNKK